MGDGSDRRVFPPLTGPAWVLSGATASGKSSVAMRWAESAGGEIVSVDSIAVYRDMDIGTAKPTAEEQGRVVHHLIDVASPDEEFSVERFLRMTHAAVEDIRRRGRIPVLVGGTPMYLKGLLRGFDPGPPADETFRGAVADDVRRHGADALHRRLWQVDPVSAARIDPTDVRRMTRALEVSYLTGRPISHRQTQFDAPAALTVTAIRWPRQTLHRRINARTDAMFDAGLVDEVRTLLRRYPGWTNSSREAVGYREVIAMLEENPDPTPDQISACRDEVATHTRQLAKRQETWLRGLTEVRFVDVSDEADLEAIEPPKTSLPT